MKLHFHTKGSPPLDLLGYDDTSSPPDQYLSVEREQTVLSADHQEEDALSSCCRTTSSTTLQIGLCEDAERDEQDSVAHLNIIVERPYRTESQGRISLTSYHGYSIAPP